MARYREVIERWNARGILVAIYDIRGHGLSEGGARSRRAVRRIHRRRARAHGRARQATTPWKRLPPPILFGHSLGGLISLHTALCAPPTSVAGSLCRRRTSDCAKQVPPLKLAVGQLLSRFLPQDLAGRPTSPGPTARTAPTSADAYDRDPLNFKKANVRWFTETRGRARAGSSTQAPRAQRSPFLPAGRRRQGRSPERDRALHGARQQRRPPIPSPARPLPRDPERARPRHLDRQVRHRDARLAAGRGRRRDRSHEL